MTNPTGIEARMMGMHEQLTFPLAYGGLANGVLSYPTTERLERSADADNEYQSYPRGILCKDYENVTAINVQPSVNGEKMILEDDRWVLQINGFRWETPDGEFRMSEAPEQIRDFIKLSGMPDGTLNLAKVDFVQVYIPARYQLDYISVEYELADGTKHLCNTPMNVKTLMFFGMTQALELHFEGQGVACLWIDGELALAESVPYRPSRAPIYLSLSHTDRVKRQEVWDWGVPAGVTAVCLSGHTLHLHTTKGLTFRTAIAHTYTKNEGPLPLA